MSILYYYCKLGTFKSMLDSKTLWLTDLTKSNDSEEVRRAYYSLWERVKDFLQSTDLDSALLDSQLRLLEETFAVQSQVDIPYGCCFCSENDLVQQWNEYGDNGAGVAIGFELECIEGITKQHPITSSLFSNAIGYEAVIYDSQKLAQELANICYAAIKDLGNKAWIFIILPTFKHYAAFIKNPTFRDEHESRIVFYPNDMFEDRPQGLGVLHTEVVPHYCLPWSNGKVSAIRSVTIGYDCEATASEIQKMLDKANIKESVSIDYSECSYKKREHNHDSAVNHSP